MKPGARRISSRGTFYYKRILPFIFVAVLACAVLVTVYASTRAGKPVPLPALLFPVAMGGLIWLVLRRVVFDLADEVLDEGDALLVRFGRETERIPLGQIINLSYTPLMNPARVTLTLRQPGRFGREVSFASKRPLFAGLLGRNPLVDELIERVDAARRR